MFSVADLFCGVGGLTLGFSNAGFEIACAFDNWDAAVDTYNSNFSHQARRSEITNTIELPPTDVIVGGPPCQGFSSAGMRRPNDQRNSLVKVFGEIVVANKPRAFLFENVEGFLTGAGGKNVLELLEPVINAGYRVHVRKINAANYGVPQHRKRVIVLGGLGWDPCFPKPTHSAFGAPGAHLAGRHLPQTPTLSEALQNMPPATKRPQEPELADHCFVPLEGDDLTRAQLMAPGQCMRDLPEKHWHPSYRRRAFRRVMDGTPSERRGGAPAGLRRLHSDEPSKAITGGALNEFLHPVYDRGLTLRECARLQTFPDDFRFTASSRDSVQLIGNAVPIKLAHALATELHVDLKRAVRKDHDGALLSFVPTLASGMSPVLARVTSEVLQRFKSSDMGKQLNLQWS